MLLYRCRRFQKCLGEDSAILLYPTLYSIHLYPLLLPLLYVFLVFPRQMLPSRTLVDFLQRCQVMQSASPVQLHCRLYQSIHLQWHHVTSKLGWKGGTSCRFLQQLGHLGPVGCQEQATKLEADLENAKAQPCICHANHSLASPEMGSIIPTKYPTSLVTVESHWSIRSCQCLVGSILRYLWFIEIQHHSWRLLAARVNFPPTLLATTLWLFN